jgi:hypothetical protein
MPQGELLPIPLQRTIGYQNQTHVVIHFKNAEPDLGRKGFQPELQDAAEQAAVGLVNHLKQWRHLLKKDMGGPPKILGEGELYDWIKQQEEHEHTHPLQIENPNFFIPVHQVSILSEPQREQDVIALFNQLLAGGVVRGIRLMATNQHEKYDGVFRYAVVEPVSNHKFDKSTNPLGVKDLVGKVPYFSKPYVLEYKYTLDALIRDFENEEKYESDIDLAVVWEAGSDRRKRYSIVSLLNLDNLQHRMLQPNCSLRINHFSEGR